jgi:hypothetical protein
VHKNKPRKNSSYTLCIRTSPENIARGHCHVLKHTQDTAPPPPPLPVHLLYLRPAYQTTYQLPASKQSAFACIFWCFSAFSNTCSKRVQKHERCAVTDIPSCGEQLGKRHRLVARRGAPGRWPMAWDSPPPPPASRPVRNIETPTYLDVLCDASFGSPLICARRVQKHKKRKKGKNIGLEFLWAKSSCRKLLQKPISKQYRFSLDFFSSRFWAFLGEGSSKTPQKTSKQIFSLSLFWPQTSTYPGTDQGDPRFFSDSPLPLTLKSHRYLCSIIYSRH